LNYTLVAVGRDISSFPYLFKLSSILKRLGNLEYVHWDRSPDEKNLNYVKDVSYKKLLWFCPSNKFTLLVGYVLWFGRLLGYLLFEADPKRLYFVSRLDAAGAIYIISLVRKSFKYVYLDRDAYHMTYKLGIFRGVVKKIESLVAKKSVLHLIPGKSRNFTNDKNVRVIENTPSRESFDEAKYKSNFLEKNTKFTIYVNGWLVDTRGAELIYRLAKRLDINAFRIIVAGPLKCKSINSLVELSVVNYLGQLSNIDSLSYYFISDVVLSFYDPKIEINRKAEPNKWFDCVFTNTHFIANYGIETAQSFLKTGLCHLINYNDDTSLLKLIERMNGNRSQLDIGSAKNLVEGLNVEFWDEKVLRIIKNYTEEENN
jgi:hypothetical protein